MSQRVRVRVCVSVCVCVCLCDEGGGEGERGERGGRTMKMRNKKQSALGEGKETMTTRGPTRENSDLGREEDGDRKEEKENRETWQKKTNQILC